MALIALTFVAPTAHTSVASSVTALDDGGPRQQTDNDRRHNHATARVGIGTAPDAPASRVPFMRGAGISPPGTENVRFGVRSTGGAVEAFLGRRDGMFSAVVSAVAMGAAQAQFVLAAVLGGILSACATVPAGHLGVVLRSDGVAPDPLSEGSHFVSLGSTVTLYDVRADEHNEDLGAVSADGAALEARASVLTFHAAPGEVVALAREVGPDFYKAVVLPIVSSTVRRVLAGMRVDQLDTPGIRRAQATVARAAAEKLRPFHIVLDSVDLRTLNVPASSAAYAAVLETGVAEQRVYLARRQIELARARSEALREKARGIEAAHAIVAPTLTPSALRHDATRAWARLLTAPSSSVEVRAADQATITEVSP